MSQKINRNARTEKIHFSGDFRAVKLFSLSLSPNFMNGEFMGTNQIYEIKLRAQTQRMYNFEP